MISEIQDLLPKPHGLVERLAQQHAACLHLPRGRPVERLDLLEVEPYQAVAVAKSVVDERERELLTQRDEPERELRQLHGSGVLVDPVEAPLRDETARVEVRIGVLLDDPCELALAGPGRHDLASELAARRDEESARAHGRIANLELQDLLGRALRAEA